MSTATTHIKTENNKPVLSDSRRVPTLRFNEFDGEWELLRLGQIGSFKNGLNKDKKDFGFGSPFVNLMDVFGKAILENDEFGLVNANEKDLALYNLLKGDVLFIRSSVKRTGVGETSLVSKDYKNTVYSGFLIRFRANEENIGFSFRRYCFSNQPFRKELLSYATSSANTNINQESLAKIKVNFPSLPEQQKIASFLSAVDNKIQQLTKKKALLEQYKKGVMQQLFSGQLRFKDENGNPYPDWEFPHANVLFKSISDKNHNSDLPILAITQDQGAIPRELIDYNMIVSEKSVASYKVVRVGDFIISLRSFQGGIEYSNYKGICSPAYNILRPTSDNVNKDFYKRYLKTEKYIRQLQSKLEGIRDGKMISFKYFSEIKLPFPCAEEQQKIATYLSSIDTKIEAVSNQITQTQTFKKGLLQQMFV